MMPLVSSAVWQLLAATLQCGQQNIATAPYDLTRVLNGNVAGYGLLVTFRDEDNQQPA